MTTIQDVSPYLSIIALFISITSLIISNSRLTFMKKARSEDKKVELEKVRTEVRILGSELRTLNTEIIVNTGDLAKTMTRLIKSSHSDDSLDIIEKYSNQASNYVEAAKKTNKQTLGILDKHFDNESNISPKNIPEYQSDIVYLNEMIKISQSRLKRIRSIEKELTNETIS